MRSIYFAGYFLFHSLKVGKRRDGFKLPIQFVVCTVKSMPFSDEHAAVPKTRSAFKELECRLTYYPLLFCREAHYKATLLPCNG